MGRFRHRLARVVWRLHDWLTIDEPLNRLGCFIADGRDWRDLSCNYKFEEKR